MGVKLFAAAVLVAGVVAIPTSAWAVTGTPLTQCGTTVAGNVYLPHDLTCSSEVDLPCERERFGIDKCSRVDIAAPIGTGRRLCEVLMARGVLAKLTHGSTIRLAPP